MFVNAQPSFQLPTWDCLECGKHFQLTQRSEVHIGPCGHVLCLQCKEKYLQIDMIVCPTCRSAAFYNEKFVLPSNYVFPADYPLLQCNFCRKKYEPEKQFHDTCHLKYSECVCGEVLETEEIDQHIDTCHAM